MSPMPPRPGAFRGTLPPRTGIPAPPWPPGYESVLMDAPALPRAPLLPMVPARRFRCRYHPQAHGTAAINRGWGADGWVLLCLACEEAVRARTLRVLSPEGGYAGSIPFIGASRCDDEPLPPDSDHFE